VKVRPKLNLKLHQTNLFPPREFRRITAGLLMSGRRDIAACSIQLHTACLAIRPRRYGCRELPVLGISLCDRIDCEGAFRSWLVRIAIDEALAILHGSISSSIGATGRCRKQHSAARPSEIGAIIAILVSNCAASGIKLSSRNHKRVIP